MDAYVCLHEHMLCVFKCPERPEEGTGSPGAEVRGCCELPAMDAGNEETSAREASTLDCWDISPNPTPPYVCRNWTFIKLWSIHSGERTLYSISFRKHARFYPPFFFPICFYALNVKIQSPTHMPPAPEPFYLCKNWPAYSQSHSSQLLTSIKLCFMKILLQKVHNTVRYGLFPSNRSKY